MGHTPLRGHRSGVPVRGRGRHGRSARCTSIPPMFVQCLPARPRNVRTRGRSPGFLLSLLRDTPPSPPGSGGLSAASLRSLALPIGCRCIGFTVSSDSIRWRRRYDPGMNLASVLLARGERARRGRPGRRGGEPHLRRARRTVGLAGAGAALAAGTGHPGRPGRRQRAGVRRRLPRCAAGRDGRGAARPDGTGCGAGAKPRDGGSRVGRGVRGTPRAIAASRVTRSSC